ncbi:hypothetical protein [Mameliella alba]|uniref:hypothetical protein n=1 Tax=Mameliella alba TaxID=561184 RepID=UPI0013FD9A07|nr:hypothetical protein [Mameliella alba]MBY6122600.1 hypothetical protein [Mameliella alba]
MLGAAVMVLVTGYAAEALEDLAGELRAAGVAGRAGRYGLHHMAAAEGHRTLP